MKWADLVEWFQRGRCRRGHHNLENTPDTHRVPPDHHGYWMTTSTTRCVRPGCDYERPGPTARGTVR